MKKNFLFIFLLFFILITSFSFVTNVKAASAITVEYKGKVVTFPDIDENNFNVCGYVSNLNGEFFVFYSFESEPIYDSETGYLKTSGKYTTYNFNLFTNELSSFVTSARPSGVHLITFYVIRNNLLYSNFDIKDKDGNICFNATDKTNDFELNLSISETDYTTALPVVISSQSFSTNEMKRYNLYYSRSSSGEFKSCDVMSFADNGNTTHQFYLNVYNNDTYHFKFVDKDTGYEIYQTIKISNIVVTQDNVNNYIDGVFRPSPYLSYEYVSDTEINILTQKFTLDEISKIDCSFAKDTTNLIDESVWTSLNFRSYRDGVENKLLYQFFLNVKNEDGSGNGTYHFRFYNKELEEYTYATFKVNFDDIIAYHRQDEQNKTTKNIFETLKDILSYINPFSENFFVYKLVELLIEGLKALFVPSEDFFSNWVTNMNEWLSERLGILYFPIDLVVTFFEKIGQISESGSATIFWSDFEFMGASLIQGGSYNLNDLVSSNETLKNVHDIYLVFTDVILWLGLLVLSKNTFVDIFGGKYDDFVEDIAEEGINYDNSRTKKITRDKLALENRRTRNHYYDKKRRGKL